MRVALSVLAGVFAVDPTSVISPYACTKVECPTLKCPAPLKPTRQGKGCCPTCWAPDHIVPLDRHTSIDSPYTLPTHEAAPASCAGAKCFQLMCPTGQKPGPPAPGACCGQCVVA
mmetsp:Transcript_51306/g.112439  ORF Transcript_51306/g.112439 Transcript_51306/m.112439 type:complete len:115 (+) Transcript_51306:79-423(+)